MSDKDNKLLNIARQVFPEKEWRIINGRVIGITPPNYAEIGTDVCKEVQHVFTLDPEEFFVAWEYLAERYIVIGKGYEFSLDGEKSKPFWYWEDHENDTTEDGFDTSRQALEAAFAALDKE